MDDEDKSAPKNRKRTESNGGSSDSELSEGWNIIDQTDVTNHDVPSSDGESVEVIDAEDESRDNVTDTEAEGDSQLSPVMDSPLVSSMESEAPAVPQEEMFDSSFCWFLFFATAAVVTSNLAFMIAENAFAWNMDVNSEAPSFLRDLPTTPKLMDGNLIKNIPWAEKEKVMVETLDDGVPGRDSGSKYSKRSQNYELNKKQPFKQSVEKHANEVYSKKQFIKQPNEKFNKQPNEKYSKQQSDKFSTNQNEKLYKYSNDESQKDFLNVDAHEIGRYFNAVSEVTTSSETRDKLNQVLVILDALYIGLNDLEEAVTENSQLHDVLKKQKHKLSQVLTEMEYGVSKSLDRIASNVLNKVRKLERRFENQWCQLERRGHQEELKGLFSNCEENGEKAQNEYQTESKYSGNLKDPEGSKINMNWNSYQYQVDKDSPGKEHGNSHANEAKEVDDYYMLVKSEMQNNMEFSKEHISTKLESNYETQYSSSNDKNDKSKYTDDERNISDNRNNKRNSPDDKGKHYNDKGKHDDEGNHFNDKEKYDDKWKHYSDKGKHYDDKGKHYNDKKKNIDDKGYEKGKFFDSKMKYDNRRTFHDDKSKDAKKFDTYKAYQSAEQHQNKYQGNYREGQTKSEKPFVPNLEPELIGKYLKESCDKGRNKFNNMYEKLKSFIGSKLRVPKKMFDSLFMKYCQVNDDSFKWEKRFNREHPKGDFSGKNNKNLLKEELIIGDDLNKNVRIVDITEVSHEDKAADPAHDNIVIPSNQPRQWVFSYDEPLDDNRTNLTGDWFFKAGETRSKIRWTHHRGDWWFERASHRRTHPRRSNWLSGRRKNWYFRRSWARQNCRTTPHDDWCDVAEDETITVPNPSFNFR